VSKVRIPNGFTPRDYQRRLMAYFDQGGKRAVCVWHRRAGKDLVALHQTCKMAHRRKAAYWHVFPTAEQGRKAIWEGFTKDGQRIMEQVFPASIRRAPRAFLPNAEMVVELKCGSIWRLLGSDKMEVVGAGPAGVVFTEYALAKPKTWDLVRPMLRENDGWAMFQSTPRGNNHFKKLFDVARKDGTWFSDVKTLADTNAYDPVRTVAEERASGMPESLIQQEYFCDFTAANVGSVFGDLIQQVELRGGLEVFDHPGDGVFTTWDLGVDDSTAIWFWRVHGDGVDFIDYYEANGKGMAHYLEVLERKGYRYAKHWVPHDARQRSFQTGVSTVDQLTERLGHSAVAIVPGKEKAGFMDGIYAFRWLLQRPDTRFHPRCDPGIEALKAYHYEWDDDRKTLSTKPFHDWSSHGADAARGVGVVCKFSEFMTRPPPPKPDGAPKPKPYTLDDLWKTAPKRSTRL
jgi:phage terminase large subunit